LKQFLLDEMRQRNVAALPAEDRCHEVRMGSVVGAILERLRRAGFGGEFAEQMLEDAAVQRRIADAIRRSAFNVRNSDGPKSSGSAAAAAKRSLIRATSGQIQLVAELSSPQPS
jgi:hypothetical protein